MIEQLNAAAGLPIVVFLAGPGYGKTTVLSQWAESPGQRPFAWLSVDEHDNDPVVLLTYVAAALDRVAPIDPVSSKRWRHRVPRWRPRSSRA